MSQSLNVGEIKEKTRNRIPQLHISYCFCSIAIVFAATDAIASIEGSEGFVSASVQFAASRESDESNISIQRGAGLYS